MPDGQVDMIVMVWRTNMFEYLGEASLGYKAAVLADGKRIEMGFPDRLQFPLGSGVTCEYVYTDTPYKAMQTMAHELGHWLLGGRHPYNGTSLHGKHAYWGILCNGQRVASCANAYEREKLGWIEVPEIPPDSVIPLTDYLSSGVAYKYHPENGWPFEFFYIENHQRLSVLDDVTTNPEDKGIWILHQQGPYMELDNLRIRPSDGNWDWENPGVVRLCFSQELPVFERGVPMTLTGVTHRDQIPTRTSAVNWMFVYKDPTGQLNCGAFFTGQMFDGAFEPNVHAVFSPYSNPSSDTWEGQPNPFSLEILSELNGVLTIRYNSDPLDAAPARRYLGLDPTAGESRQGLLSLAWGTQWTEGQRFEADVNGSELQRQIGNGGTWSSVYQGPMTEWRDSSLTYDTSGTVPVLFRVRLRDTQGKYSPWSNIFYTTVVGANAVGDETNKCDGIPSGFGLSTNFPNPFNPSTMIEFTLGSSAEVTLKLYNLVGEEVKTIISGQRLSAGLHSVLVTTDDLASGVYLYRLVTPEFSQTRKMVLQR
jgi:hypothetical protein